MINKYQCILRFLLQLKSMDIGVLGATGAPAQKAATKEREREVEPVTTPSLTTEAMRARETQPKQMFAG